MTISIWRYSHLALAVSSFVFILLASISGIILAFQPISEQIQPFHVADLDAVSVAETVAVFQEAYPEIIEIKVDANQFVLASVFTEEGDNLEGYFNPITAQYLGEEIKPSPFFQWVTNFHRSLFLKSIGRFFVGLCSFFLFLIAITGFVLVLKRQRGLKQFFSKIVNENFSQYWHVVLGRWSLIPIIIISLSGVYLSLEKFDLLPKHKASHQIDFETLQESPKQTPADFPIFQSVKLSELVALEFPFSSDVEDYFTLKLKKRELVVNQFTGEVLSEIKSPLVTVLSTLSLNLHTGKGSILWSLILAIASVNILFFVYSGFVMTFKRRASNWKNKYQAEESEYIILVGSENGSTFQYAKTFYQGLLKEQKKVFVSEMNAYAHFPKAKQIIIMTATYGQGEAPTNANKFLTKLAQVNQPQIAYAVVGFGSLAYPDFCQFAFEVDNAMNEQYHQFLEPFTINDKSVEAFYQWVAMWSQKTGISVSMPKDQLTQTPKQTKKLKVVAKTSLENQPDQTFLLTLKPKRSQSFQSGDLLAVYPKNDYRERLYSIGKVNGQVHLSIRYHDKGLGSHYLNDVNVGDVIKGKIIKNSHFHLPKKAGSVLMIANGTGVAPFLGMMSENRSHDLHLYLGLRTQESYQLYQTQIETHLKEGRLKECHLALSRENHRDYVQDLLFADAEKIARLLLQGGTVMICGSLAMQKGVLTVLESICADYLNKPLSYFQNNQQLKMDCY